MNWKHNIVNTKPYDDEQSCINKKQDDELGK